MDTAEFVSDRPLELRKQVLLAGDGSRTSAVIPVFTSTLFVSAFLLFLVQPMVAKMVLPLLGGSPMVWNTCMVFFQIALLVGYAYAHGATKKLNPPVQMATHAVLVLLPFSVLPFLIRPDSAHPPENAPVAWLLLLLAGAIGLPFLTLATTASVLQHWFSRTNHPSARDPYFLYVASNIGSFIALIAYPTSLNPPFRCAIKADSGRPDTGFRATPDRLRHPGVARRIEPGTTTGAAVNTDPSTPAG